MEKPLKILSKIALYTTGLVMYLALLFRGLVPYLWGSRMDLVVMATPFVAVIGLILFAIIAYKLYLDIRNTK